ncbi:MAG: very short patch repair endonuclease [Candidatus Pacebacteria bacterium]|nr:very short patch repair endonuclease [Candidatus Paceibacterota bacterium]
MIIFLVEACALSLMPDNLTKEQRSLCMSHIRSRWTSAEKKLHNFLKGSKIKHKMHPKISGSPDVILPKYKKAVFIQGCFWHKCPSCYKEPKSRKKYWLPKIERNIQRDRKNEKILKKNGWKIVKIWEHELKKNKNRLSDFFSKKLL